MWNIFQVNNKGTKLKAQNWCKAVFLGEISVVTPSAKLRLEDILKTSPKAILWTSPYSSLCNTKVRPLPTSSGRWNMTSWGRPNVTSWGHPLLTSCGHLLQTLWGCNLVLYLTARDTLRTCFSDVLKTLLYGSTSKAKKRLRDKDFCI